MKIDIDKNELLFIVKALDWYAEGLIVEDDMADYERVFELLERIDKLGELEYPYEEDA